MNKDINDLSKVISNINWDDAIVDKISVYYVEDEGPKLNVQIEIDAVMNKSRKVVIECFNVENVNIHSAVNQMSRIVVEAWEEKNKLVLNIFDHTNDSNGVESDISLVADKIAILKEYSLT